MVSERSQGSEDVHCVCLLRILRVHYVTRRALVLSGRLGGGSGGLRTLLCLLLCLHLFVPLRRLQAGSQLRACSRRLQALT